MKTISKLSIIIVVILSMVVITVQSQGELPEKITIEFENLLPEGIEWDSTREQFLIGSWTQGTVFAVSDDAELTPILDDDELYLINGIHIDRENSHLLVSNTATTAPIDCPEIRESQPFTAVGVFDLETGERIHMVNLSGLVPQRGSLINDITSDADGNIYATDWCGSAIYKIDPDGNASVLLEDDSYYFETELGAGAFNGIDWHPDNYLIISGGFGTPLYKVTLGDTPTITAVSLDVPIFVDGITMLPDGDIVIGGALFHEEGFDATTMWFSSEDDWETGTLQDNVVHERFATTVALRDGAVYSVISGVIEPFPVNVFEILRVEFSNEDAEAMAEPSYSPDSIMGLLDRNVVYSDLVQAIETAGLANTLQTGQYTIFAPTNLGFDAFTRETGLSFEEILEREDLADILEHHLVKKIVTNDNAVDGSQLTTVHGGILTIEWLGDTIFDGVNLIDGQGRSGALSARIEAKNGVIIPINQIMLPLP